MTLSPLRAGVVLAAGMLAIPAGCETFRPADPERGAVAEGISRGVEPYPTAPVPASPPGKHATRRGNYVFYHDFPLDAGNQLFAELEELPDQVFGELGLPPATAIVQVFLFDTQERYERFMKLEYPKLPPRRAYFLTKGSRAGGDELMVYTWVGDHLRTDLRHELTHALLHSVLKDVPLWLDEGLAGYFELPPENGGVNPQHLESVRRQFMPDLARLEKLEQVAQMQKPEYREAWAWVHLMLRGSPAAKQVLWEYLQVLRTTDKPGLLMPRLKEALPDPDRALFDHLASQEMPRHRAASPR